MARVGEVLIWAGLQSGMVDKLCELVYDQMQSGQVIIIPDGPKPLIMAMSLIPDIVKKDGVTCLHISRNTNFSDFKQRHRKFLCLRRIFLEIPNNLCYNASIIISLSDTGRMRGVN